MFRLPRAEQIPHLEAFIGQFNKRMEALIPVENGFVVKTSQSQYNSTNVLLALGRRGTPRKLGVPGEEQAKVVYRLIDAEQSTRHPRKE